MEVIEENILNINKGIITQQVNCRKVMNAGLAKSIRNKYPNVYTSFMKYDFKLGDIQLIKVTDSPLYICNLAGQDNFGREERCYTDYGSVKLGLTKLQSKSIELDLQVYIPWGMGAGLAKGNWGIIYRIIEKECPKAILIKLPNQPNEEPKS